MLIALHGKIITISAWFLKCTLFLTYKIHVPIQRHLLALFSWKQMSICHFKLFFFSLLTCHINKIHLALLVYSNSVNNN